MAKVSGSASPVVRRLAIPVLVAALLFAGCGRSPAPVPPQGAASADVVLLANLGRLASERARQTASGATLHQVDVIPGDGRYIFRFYDSASARVVSATGPTDATTTEAFTLSTDATSVLAATPSTPLDIGPLRLGPDGVVAVMVRELGAATPRTLTLFALDGRLTWHVEVNGPRGIVSGTVADESGAFVQDAARP